MLRILTPEPAAEGLPPNPSAATGEEEIAGEFEIVLGRRQVASLSFVVVVALALTSGAAYLAGKAAAGKAGQAKAQEVKASSTVSATVAATVAAVPVTHTEPSGQGMLFAGTTAIAPATANPDAPAAPAGPADDGSRGSPGVNALLASDTATALDESVFGEPVPGSLYVQVGAMDRGPAMILTSGLRKRGFPTLTAHGPSATIFRVLVGPYKTLPEYQNAKEAISQMGIPSFGRYGGQ